MTKWQQRFFDVADLVSTWSKDKSTKVASVIVDEEEHDLICVGYNGFPGGVEDDIDERHDRPAKYLWTEHGERNAIYNAAKRGLSLRGYTLYTRWFPCADCMRAIIQSRLKKVVCEKVTGTDRDKRWEESFKVSLQMAKEAGIEIEYVE
jgi:dCMP deaminase